jgi:hypothetical protein
VVRDCRRVTLGDRVVLPYTMTALHRNLPGVRRSSAAPCREGAARPARDAPALT